MDVNKLNFLSKLSSNSTCTLNYESSIYFKPPRYEDVDDDFDDYLESNKYKENDEFIENSPEKKLIIKDEKFSVLIPSQKHSKKERFQVIIKFFYLVLFFDLF